MSRRDWYVGRLHIIRRGYSVWQCGLMLWGWASVQRHAPTLDVWVRRTLWTFRWRRQP